MLTDALPEAQAHVAGDQTHIFRDPVVVHEITREPFDRGRVLARRHVDDIVLHEIGDHGDAIAAPAAGLVDADGLHTHVVLQPPRLVDVMGDGPPQTGVGLVQLLGERADGQVAGHLHGPRLEQEREPAAGPGPRGGHRHHPAPKPPTTNSERPKISDETRNTDLTKYTLLCELHGVHVSEGRVEPLVVVPPYVPVGVRAQSFHARVDVVAYGFLLDEPVGGFDHRVVVGAAGIPTGNA
mgnify:CR=1 FL=1